MKLLLFDIDGTLISTGGAGIRALNRAFQNLLAVEGAMEGILPHGKTDPAIIREIFSNCQHLPAVGRDAVTTEHLLASYLTYLKEEVETSSSYLVLPGVLDLLQKLDGRPDIGLGLATGNIELGARLKLERGDLNRYFTFGGFGSDSEHRAELVRCAGELGMKRYGKSVSRDDIFVIGDTPRDIAAGREAGYRTIGVATSTYTLADLDAAGADLAVRDLEQDCDQFMRVTRIV